MIQVYKRGNNNFNKNGDLQPEVISAESVINLNGTWEFVAVIPAEQEYVDYITNYTIIKTRMPGNKEDQLWYVYKTEKNDNEITAYARPVFLQAAEDCILLDVRPTAKNGQEAIELMCAQNPKYSGKSDIQHIETAYYYHKNLIEAIQGEDENSFLNRWGGEVEYDNFCVIINERVGGNYGMRAEMGYNVNGIQETVDIQDVITRIYPIGFNGRMLTGEQYIDSGNAKKYPFIHTRFIKYEDVKYMEDIENEEERKEAYQTLAEFEDELRRRVKAEYDSGVDLPRVTYSVDFIELSQTDEYKKFKNLLDVGMGDTVKVRHRTLGIETEARCITIAYDHVDNKIIKITLGQFEGNYLDKMNSVYNAAEKVLDIKSGTVIADKVAGILDAMKTQLQYQREIAEQQEVRAIIFEDLVNGSPTYGAMCMGTKGLEIAKERTADGKDWKWTTAITAEGIQANTVISGLLSDREGKNWWNLDTGDIRLSGEAYIGDQTINETLEEISMSKPLTIVLSNEYQGITTDSNGNYVSFPECSTTVSVYFGTENISGKVQYDISTKNVTGKWDLKMKTYTVTELSAEEGYVDVSVEYLTITAKKRFKISKIKSGADGTPGKDGSPGKDGQPGKDGVPGRTYFMELSTPIIKLAKDNSVVPEKITVSAFYRDGTSAERTEYAGRFVVEETPDGKTWYKRYTSEANEKDVTFSPYAKLAAEDGNIITAEDGEEIIASMNVDIVQMRVTLYASGGTGIKLDTQGIVIVKDVDALSHEEIFELLTNNGVVKGIYQEGNQLYISFSYAKGGTLVLGGKGNGNGKLIIKDENEAEIGHMDNNGVDINGVFRSISHNGDGEQKSEISSGEIKLYEDNENVLMLRPSKWKDIPDKKGCELHGNKDYFSFSQGYTPDGYLSSRLLIDENLKLDGYNETIKIFGDTRINGRLKAYRYGFPDGKYVGYYSNTNDIYVNSDFEVNGSLNVKQSKHRIVDSENFGQIYMNSFETSEPFFSEIGSAKIRELEYIRIDFDPIFAETIDVGASYHIFITLTHGHYKKIEKHKEYFIVYGDKNTEFDWMLVCRQKGYAGERNKKMPAKERKESYDILDDFIINNQGRNIAELYNGIEEIKKAEKKKMEELLYEN